MKDTLALLVLLYAQTIKINSQPYQADSDGNCRNMTTEYLVTIGQEKMCCKKCAPGNRLTQQCSATAESVCEQCPVGQYLETWNYSPQCFTCTKCKKEKGLQYIGSCSSTTNPKCTCQPGMYCKLGYDPPYCSDCSKYKMCPVGQGVVTQGKENSNVKCKPCTEGTFSDIVSFTDRCRTHTKCNGRAVLRKGNATSDTVCEPHASTRANTVVPNSESMAATSSTTQSARPFASEKAIPSSTESLPPTTEPHTELVIACSIGFIFCTIILILTLLVLYKRLYRRGSARLDLKVDANGNFKCGETNNFLVDSNVASFKNNSQEQEYLLEKGEASSDHSHCTNNTETLTNRTDDYSSHESIGPLQPTSSLDNPHSLLSEPLTLHSNAEPIAPQPSIQTQSSSQPNSPQIITPVTTSPHVNVNITLHIGNGSCKTPAFMSSESMQADYELPFGEAESFSTPQQEDGKTSLMSVQESSIYSIQQESSA